MTTRSRSFASLGPLALAMVAVASAHCASAPDDAAPAGGARFEGRLRAYVVDDADGTSRTGYALETTAGDLVELDPSPALAGKVGHDVVLQGHERPAERSSAVRAGAPRVAVSAVVSSRKSERAEPLVNGGPPHTAHAAVVLLNFQNVTPQPFTPAQAKTYLASVHDYYKEISYGSWTVQTDVFGPFTVPKPADCSLDTIGKLGRQAAKDKGVAIDGYDHVGVTVPQNSASGLDCACGLAWVGTPPAQPNANVQGTSLYTCYGENAFAHEMGHGFGLDHASTAHCNGQAMRRNPYDACSIDEYGNHFNTMGNGLGHMNAYQKAEMKWLDACNIVRVSKNGVFTLKPIQVAGDDVQALQIPTGDTRDGNPLFYYVEYRNPAKATFNAKDDDGTVREKGTGVHIDVAPGYGTPGGDHRSLLLDLSATGKPGDFVDPRLTAGRSFTDPDGKVTVTVVKTDDASAEVQVTFPGGGSGANTCANGALAPGASDKGVVALYEDCGYAGWEVSLAPGDYSGPALVALGAKVKDASSLWVADGYEAVLFQNADFTGASVTIAGAESCLVAKGFNDVASSVRIKAKGAGGSGGAAGAGGGGSAGKGGSATAGGAGAGGSGGSGGVVTGGSGGASGAGASGKGGAAGTPGKGGSGGGGGSAGAAGGGSSGKGGAMSADGGVPATTDAGASGKGGASAGPGPGQGGGVVLPGAETSEEATGDESGSACSAASGRGTGSGGPLVALGLAVAALRRRRLRPSR